MMDKRDEIARLRDEENHDQFAVRKQEQNLVRLEREMDREMEDFVAAEERAERQVEEEWRQEHWGHEPERPPAWPKRGK
jgi:hypothetical protein